MLGATAAGIGAASGILGGIGASNAAEEQIKMMEQIAQGYGKLGQQQYDWISPWMEAGTQALTAQMQMLANPMNQQAALSGFYGSPVYAEQMEQANYATNAAAEAGGNLGTSSGLYDSVGSGVNVSVFDCLNRKSIRMTDQRPAATPDGWDN